MFQRIRCSAKEVFFVGDTHGQYLKLLRALKKAQFDPSQEHILISTGDLIDRGPDSLSMLKLLQKDWFYSVRGNHEQMLLDTFFEQDEVKRKLIETNWQIFNGGDWYKKSSIAHQEVKTVLPQIRGLPLAIEVITEDARIGVVHATVPQDSWNRDWDRISADDRQTVLWDRHNGRLAKSILQESSSGSDVQENGFPRVSGIDRLIVGHTMIRRGMPTLVNNTLFLEVGCAQGETPCVMNGEQVLSITSNG